MINNRTILILFVAACFAFVASAQDYTPADGFYDLSDMPETGMYPEGGPKPKFGRRGPPKRPAKIVTETVVIGPATFTIDYPVFGSFAALPDDVVYIREPIRSFIDADGKTHHYEVVLVESMNVSWVQAALLAESAGGYLASLTTPEENEFVFSLIDDDKYFWEFPDDYTADSNQAQPSRLSFVSETRTPPKNGPSAALLGV